MNEIVHVKLIWILWLSSYLFCQFIIPFWFGYQMLIKSSLYTHIHTQIPYKSKQILKIITYYIRETRKKLPMQTIWNVYVLYIFFLFIINLLHFLLLIYIGDILYGFILPIITMATKVMKKPHTHTTWTNY